MQVTNVTPCLRVLKWLLHAQRKKCNLFSIPGIIKCKERLKGAYIFALLQTQQADPGLQSRVRGGTGRGPGQMMGGGIRGGSHPGSWAEQQPDLTYFEKTDCLLRSLCCHIILRDNCS